MDDLDEGIYLDSRVVMVPETYMVLLSSICYQKFLLTWKTSRRFNSFIYYGYSFAHRGWERLINQLGAYPVS